MLSKTLNFSVLDSKLWPAGQIQPSKIFYPARGAFFNIYTHFEALLDRIMSGIPKFQFFIFLFFLENTPRFLEKNSEIRDEIEVFF